MALLKLKLTKMKDLVLKVQGRNKLFGVVAVLVGGKLQLAVVWAEANAISYTVSMEIPLIVAVDG